VRPLAVPRRPQRLPELAPGPSPRPPAAPQRGRARPRRGPRPRGPRRRVEPPDAGGAEVARGVPRSPAAVLLPELHLRRAGRAAQRAALAGQLLPLAGARDAPRAARPG